MRSPLAGSPEPPLFSRVRVGILVLFAVSCVMALVEDRKEAKSLEEFLVETRAKRLAKQKKVAEEVALNELREPNAKRELLVREETVLDTVSQLEWHRTDSPQRVDWSAAKAYCASLEGAGGGWHLPSRDELVSLLRRNPDPMDGGVEWFWTASVGLGTDVAWAVGSDSWLNANPVSTRGRARCVRPSK